MTRPVAIKLMATGGPGCMVVDLTTAQPIPNVRKVTLVCEVGKPTVATIEILAADTEALAEATIVAPQVVEQILQDLKALQETDLPEEELAASPREIEAVLRRRLGLAPLQQTET
ncbi:hypothetical protein [uncultured Reyranella sp.]|uniref:hypothetical protein n=1 Tax=uncultured Reyranella sp. TaxID=735512 RepID=UPI00259CC62C|nr:hypothetical protein [uncultured Reyranella sp.]